jgi:hypothetical protein
MTRLSGACRVAVRVVAARPPAGSVSALTTEIRTLPAAAALDDLPP